MPIMDGNELCTKLIKINPNFKVILMSAYSDIKYIKEKFLFVNKPVSIAPLVELVREYLSKKIILIANISSNLFIFIIKFVNNLIILISVNDANHNVTIRNCENVIKSLIPHHTALMKFNKEEL
jgi:response regulator RpfG family c-di-GMP phosphodiesterase